jgi:hypothetical protein
MLSRQTAYVMGSSSMHLQTAEYWGQRAVRAKYAANKLAGLDAGAVMLEMAQHYETLAHRARMIAVILGEAPSAPEGLSCTDER